MKEIKYLSPFKKLCFNVGTLPSVFDDSLTYYEALCYFMDYLEKEVIPTVNNNGEAIELLQSFVSNYFNNLDVQEEINNKLDEMAEDGTLQEIISSYLETKAIFCFDNVELMKESSTIINGSYVKTLGYYSKNDGGKGLYKIRTLTNSDVIDESFIISLNNESLIAELIYNSEINVLSLGIKNDSTADCSLVITNALNKVKTLYFPKGTYKIDDTIELTNGCNLKGENMALSMLITDKDKPIIDITSKYFCTIKNLHFRGSNDWDNQTTPLSLLTSQNLIKIIGSNDCYFKNIYVDNAQANGIFLDESTVQSAIQINFENIYVKNNTKNGIYLGTVHGCKIDKGNCEYNGESNILIEKLPSDINISNLNFNFNNKSKKSPLIINANNTVSNIKIDGLHIEDMSQETPTSHTSTCCLDINASMLDIGNLYIRYNPLHFNDCIKIQNTSRVSLHDSIIRQVNNPIVLPTSSGCMIRNVRTFDTTGSRVQGRGANYEDNQVIKNTSAIFGSDGGVSQYVIGGVHLPRTFNFIYSAQLFIPMGISSLTGNIYMTVYNNEYNQIASETINLASFTNKRYDITSLLSSLNNPRAIKIVMPQAVAQANTTLGITVDTV